MKITTAYETDEQGMAVLPEHPDDEQWSFVLLHGDNEQTVADTATELLEIVIDGYAEAKDEAEAFGMRFDHACAIADLVQKAMLDDFASKHEDKIEAFTDNDFYLTAVLRPKYDTLPEEWFDQPWEGDDFPELLLVSTMYAPYQPTKMPEGNKVRVIDPYREISYLKSLSELGLVVFLQPAE